jgi:hypothetical protein
MDEEIQEGDELARVIPELANKDKDKEALSVAYLDAGAELISRALDHDLTSETPNPFLECLSQKRLERDVNRRITARDLAETLDPTDGKFRGRWKRHYHYLAHLIRWVQHKNQRKGFPAAVAAAIYQAVADPLEPVSTRIREIGKANLESLFESSHFRIQLFLINLGASDRNRSLLPDFYLHVEQRWLPTIRELVVQNHLTLRPGIREEDLLDILTAIGEGLTLRELADRSTGSDRERRLSLQATAALALLVACTSDDGVSLEDAADEVIRKHRAGN